MIVGGTIAAILCVVTAALAVLLLSKLYIKRKQRKRINDIARYSDFICYHFCVIHGIVGRKDTTTTENETYMMVRCLLIFSRVC